MYMLDFTEQVCVAVKFCPFIREVFGSNLGRNTGYTDSIFMVFLSPFRKISG
jgi:hypothetical protein